jgi:hypothetical protein
MKTETTTAAQPGKFDPSTWAGQARQTAKNQATSTTMLWGVVVAVLLMLAALAMRHLVGLAWSEIAADLAVALGVGVAWLFAVYVISYARTLRNDNAAVRARTWLLEVQTGQDLDGDGQVGQPAPVGHVMKIGGNRPREVVLPDLDPPRETRPLVRFPVPANDVIYILTRAAKDGLGFREWDGHRLPTSGATVDRLLWTAVIDGMVDWEMVQASTDAAGRRRVRLAGDATVDEMIAAVRQSVAGKKP